MNGERTTEQVTKLCNWLKAIGIPVVYYITSFDFTATRGLMQIRLNHN